jgi:NAD(P)-dependent dehydrogenase (short-subunit alcohol dehydrogenase family)
MAWKVFPSKITAEFGERFPDGIPKEMVPLERMGSEEEMAGTILYLASKAGGYCDGSVLLFDGGVMTVKPSSY